MRLSAVMVSSWRAGKLSSDRAGASASRPKSLSLDVHLDVTLRAKIHDLRGAVTLGVARHTPGVFGASTCAYPGILVPHETCRVEYTALTILYSSYI